MTDEYNAVKPALDRGDENVIDSKSSTSLPTIYFRDFVPDEKRFEEVDSFYDCFLAHEWGGETSEFLTHERVIEIAKRLKEQGIRAWIDPHHLKRTIDMDIPIGLESSRKVVFLVTARYI